MKKIGFLMFALVSANFMFSMQSCSSGDDENPTNHFTYNSTDFDLGAQGIIQIDRQATDGVYKHALEFTTPGVRYSADLSNISGKGDIIFVWMNSPSPDKIAPGTYQFDPKNTELYNAPDGALVFDVDFDALANADEDDDIDYESVSFEKGSITVKEESGIYEITWTLEDKDGKKITGYFKGDLLKYIPEI